MKRAVIFLITLVFLFLLFPENIFGDTSVNTSINVTNSVPILIEPIPDQGWAENTPKLDAFDLDDFFMDPNGDEISYSFIETDNISIVIDSENVVSFFPDSDFIGIRNTSFIASDGKGNSSSNTVFLYVGVDDEAPRWHDPSKSRITIYQNYHVNFSTYWTDNFGLKSFLFSIKQGTSWKNYSQQNFSGTTNTSLQRIQISASGGSTVQWRFYAWDTSDNMNVTDIQNFTVSSYPSYPTPDPPTPDREDFDSGDGVGGRGDGFFEEFFEPTEPRKEFSVEPELLKLTLKQGDSETKILKITITGNTNLSFNVSQKNFDGVILLDKDSFHLDAGETIELVADFNIPDNLKPDQYFGYIVIDSSNSSKKVPVILDVEAKDAIFNIDVNISEDYKALKADRPVKANITIEPLGSIKSGEGTLYYALRDMAGNIYDSNEEKINYSSITNIEKELYVPENVREGYYVFYARFSAENENAIGSDIFEVGVRYNIAALIKSSFIFIIILILALILSVLMYRYKAYKERERALNLYIMLHHLRKLVRKEKYDSALNLYIKIKSMYGQRVSEEVKTDRDKLIKEIKKLSSVLNKPKHSKKKSDSKESDKKDKKDKEDKESDKENKEEDSDKKEKKDKEKEDKKNKSETIGEKDIKKSIETAKKELEKNNSEQDKEKENNKEDSDKEKSDPKDSDKEVNKKDSKEKADSKDKDSDKENKKEDKEKNNSENKKEEKSSEDKKESSDKKNKKHSKEKKEKKETSKNNKSSENKDKTIDSKKEENKKEDENNK